jgi:hypothetical protein
LVAVSDILNLQKFRWFLSYAVPAKTLLIQVMAPLPIRLFDPESMPLRRQARWCKRWTIVPWSPAENGMDETEQGLRQWFVWRPPCEGHRPIIADAAINIMSSLEHKRDIDKSRNWLAVNNG